MRFHLFEFTDLVQCPAFIKSSIQEYLDYVSERFQIFQVAMPLLDKALKGSRASEILDLGSGAGSGMQHAWKPLIKSNPGLTIQLSDLNPIVPPPEFTEEGIEYVNGSVDARSIPRNMPGFRTMFTVAHHFRPEVLKNVIQDARNSNSGLAIFEPVHRGITSILSMVLILPCMVLVFTPFIRPWRFSRLFFTYIIPVITFAIVWDGIVSSLRAYKPDELLRLARSTEGPDWHWDCGILTGPSGVKITYLTGVPYRSN